MHVWVIEIKMYDDKWCPSHTCYTRKEARRLIKEYKDFLKRHGSKINIYRIRKYRRVI